MDFYPTNNDVVFCVKSTHTQPGRGHTGQGDEEGQTDNQADAPEEDTDGAHPITAGHIHWVKKIRESELLCPCCSAVVQTTGKDVYTRHAHDLQ